MPNLTPNQPALRADGHAVEFYVGFFTGATVVTGVVSAVPLDGATAISYTLSTGDAADVQRGYRVVFKTSGGAFKGATHVRASGTISSTSIPVREIGRGGLTVTTGDLIEVWNVIEPGDKLVEASELFKPDGLSVGTGNSALPPLANTGGHDIGFVDAGQTYRTVSFFGSLSDSVDADSSGTLTHSWSAPTATGTTSSTSADPTFTFPVGEHVVTYTATDASNSATWTTYRRVKVGNDGDFHECVIESVESDIENGTSARFQVFEDAMLADVYDGCMAAIFRREWINGTEQSFGSDDSGRSHIVAIGYLRRDENRFSGEDGVAGLTFDLISPLAFYREVSGYSKVATNVASADAWDELDDLSVWRMIVQIARRYTWLTESWDFIQHSSFSDKLYSQFFIQKSNPVDQMLELTDGVDARLTCTRSGRFEVQTRPEYMAESSRSGLTTTLTLGPDDWAEVNFNRNHWRPVETIEGRGFTAGASGNSPIFARWPGLSPGKGTLNEAVERLIASSQGDLNSRLGRRAADRDGVYLEADGTLNMAVEGTVSLPGSYLVFDPAHCEYVNLDVDATYNRRGVDLNDHRFVLRRVTWEPGEDGTGQTVLDYRTATNGGAAATYHPPQESDSGLPDWTPPSYNWDLPDLPDVVIPEWTWDDFPTDAEPVKLFVTLYGAATTAEGLVYRATSWVPTTGAVSYEAIGGAARGITGRCVWATSDPYDYRARYVLTTTGLFHCPDIWVDAGSLTWTQVATNLQMFGNSTWVGNVIRGSINRRDYLATASGNIFAWSTDGGATWNRVAINGAAQAGLTDPVGLNAQFAISPRNNGSEGHIYAFVGRVLYKSLDWGATWTLKFGLGGAGANQGLPHVPYMNLSGAPNLNGSSQVVYLTVGGGDNQHRFARSDNGGTSVAYEVTAAAFAPQYGHLASPNGINTYTLNGSNVFFSTIFWSPFYRYGYNGTVSGSQAYRSAPSGTRNVNGWPTDPSIALLFSNAGILEYWSNLQTDATPTTPVSKNLLTSLGALTSQTNVTYAEWDLSDYVPPQ